MRKTTSKYIIIKLLKTNCKQKILKSAQVKKHIMYNYVQRNKVKNETIFFTGNNAR